MGTPEEEDLTTLCYDKAAWSWTRPFTVATIHSDNTDVMIIFLTWTVVSCAILVVANT